ncbi:MAG: DUF5706 domain-containing protein [Candidatus Peribacteraceae bacterium]|nr:DUF5706 domain-containing protein [Candidatus Peribacteraceae bacterium]MDD5074810.1 DUF5706 domain-containing protein [Candidatus Peribacteraceae bacterium]
MNPEQLETNLGIVHEWTRNADNKVSILLGFNGVFLLAFLSTSLDRIISAFNTWLLFTGYCVAFILFAVSIYKLLSTIYPYLEHGQEKKSPLFFGDIASMSLTEFSKKIDMLKNEKIYIEELKRQIHACSVIAKEKYQKFRDGLAYTGVAILLLGLLEIWQQSQS